MTGPLDLRFSAKFDSKSPYEGCQWRNLLGCDHWVLAGTPRPKIVGFCDLVGVAIAPLSKKLAVE